MFTDNAKLTYSIQDKRVSIIDNISHNMFVRNASSFAEEITLPAEVIYNHIQTIQRCLVGQSVAWWMYKPFTKERGENVTKIIEYQDCLRFIVEGKCAEYRYGTLVGERNFNIGKLLRDINFAYSLVVSEGTVLHPVKDCCRFYVDSNIFVVKGTDAKLVVQDKDVHKGYLNNVILNDNVYKCIYFKLDEHKCTFWAEEDVTLFTVPVDRSILTYLDVEEEDENNGEESLDLG